MAASLNDTEWLRHAFMIPLNANVTRQGVGNTVRYATSAAYKFENTEIGGMYTINNPPQFTRFADIPQPGRGRTEDQRDEGMGSYYSEAIDDTKQMVNMSFGVPQYNNMFTFFTNFYDRNMAALANSGRASPVFYNLGLTAGYIVTLPMQLPFQATAMAGRVIKFLTKQDPSKWYYFKESMHTYWSTVNVIANELAINMGITPRVFGNREDLQDPGQEVTQADIQRMHTIFPDIFRKDGGVDVMAIANRAQRKSDRSQLAMTQLREGAETRDELANMTARFMDEKVYDPDPNASAKDFMATMLQSPAGEDKGGSLTESFSSWWDLTWNGVKEFAVASQRDGSQFVSFRANYNGTMSESFSNSTREADIASKVNSQVTDSRNAAFNMMGGNVAPGMGAMLDAIQSLGAGLLDSVKLGGLATLAGTAFVDIPKMYDTSTANLPRAEYTVPLYSPMGNKISRFINLMLPISCLLAGALPRAAGRSSWTQPFLCQIYHQGRVQIKLGMIDSITITRGTGTVGWNAENEMLGAEMTFSVVDMSSLMYAPIKGSFAGPNWYRNMSQAGLATIGDAIGGSAGAGVGLALGGSDTVWDENSAFNDYLAVMGALPIRDSYYVGRRLALNMTRAVQNFKNWRSPSNFMSWILDGGTARTLSAFSQYSERL